VSLIGAGINDTAEKVIAGRRCLGEAGIPISGTATSSFRITYLVPNDQTREAVKVLHGRFVSEQDLVP
jgi:aspartokinase